MVRRGNNTGIWGPVTATLDWCEANYQFSPYIAEMANTMSNIVTVGLALHQMRMLKSQDMPSRYLVGVWGMVLIGLGSFAFHATLRFGAQLADELPMIYVVTNSCFALYDGARGYDLKQNQRSRRLMAFCIAFDVFFTWSYWMYRNPVYHQMVFATLMVLMAWRVTYLLNWSQASPLIPADKKSTIGRLFGTGSGLFAFGFLIWNLDNIYCPTLTEWKHAIGWPLAFLLEGHSWWHVFTAAGSYLMSTGTGYLTLCIKDSPHKYELGWTAGLIPHVKRISKKD